MIAIASILDVNADRKTRDLWLWLNEKCDYSNIKITQTPHLSWQTAESYNLNDTEVKISKLANYLTPFSFKTTGLGIFTHKRYILYLSVPVSDILVNIHKMLWEELEENALERNKLYSNGYWVPHISIIFNSIESEKLLCAISELINTPIEFEVLINSIDILYQENEEFGVLKSFKFKK